jgi:hypothetical protein
MVRFLQLFETGAGDYTAERDRRLSGTTIEDIVAEAEMLHRDSG